MALPREEKYTNVELRIDNLEINFVPDKKFLDTPGYICKGNEDSISKKCCISIHSVA